MTRRPTRTAPARVPYAFLSPAIVLFAVFMVVPIGYTVYLSLRRAKVTGLGLGAAARSESFAGLANYRAVLDDDEFWRSAVRVLIYGGLLVPTMLGLALLFALLLDLPRARARRFSRIAIFLPYAVPAVIASLMWGFIYLPSVGPGQWLLVQAGGDPVNLLGPTSIYFSIANIAVWGGTGFNMIVIYTALRAVPTEMYEAARLDGATEAQIAWRIKIPMLMPALIMTFVFSLIATLQVFSEPTTLRPLTNALPSNWTPLMKIYQDAFARDDIHSAAAASVVLALVTLVFSFGFLQLVQRRAFGSEQ
ncbi:carbohydrate ABC transporter permease [Dactylosporangium siamense]|uniref:carbohydrate ABC transporter permease n=1 Tax=Dactylosporangium siamense TaxID=685454 RepID=UPI00194267B6|nr:sugar ABC transporter permease [Dactylosporangium siamense]